MLTDRQPVVLSVNVILMVLTITAVGARFTVRKVFGPGLWWDDWLSVACLPFCIYFSGSMIYFIRYGFGLRISQVSSENRTAILQSLYVAMLVYQTGTGFVKASILLFYRRIFPTRYVKVGCWILGLSTAVWTIVVNVVWATGCSPVEVFWAATSGKCAGLLGYLLGQGIASIVLDVFILFLPIRPLWKLQMPISRKIAVTLVFGIATIAVLCSIIRQVLVVTQASEDYTYGWVPGLTFSIVELDISVICSCLPILKPLIPSLRKKRDDSNVDLQLTHVNPKPSKSFTPKKTSTAYPKALHVLDIRINDLPPRSRTYGMGSGDSAT